MDAGHQQRPGGPGRREGTIVRHAANEHTPSPFGYDSELQLHNQALLRACGIQPPDHVLDIGCGTGQTTRQAARTAQAGSALGVDISAPAIERARELARAEGLGNVTFEHASAQVHRFPQERFDLATSRFGTMFFDDPGAAFANIGRALHHAGRLVMMVWQHPEHNEWDVAIRQSLGATEGPVASPCAGSDPFSLADPPTVKQLLGAAGFTDITFTDVHEPVYYGPDVTTALDWVRGFTYTSEVLERLDPAAAARALERLRETLAAHLSDHGVWFGSRAWIITARRH
jgi:ubiquinone/menaquinone biosynthesis C-methylase UbiE